MGRKAQDNLDRFFAKVNVTDGCWEWTAGCDPEGYAQFKAYDGKGQYRTVRAARWRYERMFGKPAQNILHKCDNRKCVRLDHLEDGSQSKNIKDCYARGRGVDKRGTKHHNAKLTEEIVRKARSEFDGKWGSITRLARKYGVADSTMHNAIHKDAWLHV